MQLNSRHSAGHCSVRDLARGLSSKHRYRHHIFRNSSDEIPHQIAINLPGTGGQHKADCVRPGVYGCLDVLTRPQPAHLNEHDFQGRPCGAISTVSRGPDTVM